MRCRERGEGLWVCLLVEHTLTLTGGRGDIISLAWVSQRRKKKYKPFLEDRIRLPGGSEGAVGAYERTLQRAA